MAKKEETAQKQNGGKTKKNIGKSKRSLKTSKTTKKTRKKKTKINYTCAIAGFLAVCVIMLAVFLFVIPSIKTKDQNPEKAQIVKEENTSSKTIEDDKAKSKEATKIQKKTIPPDNTKTGEKSAVINQQKKTHPNLIKDKKEKKEKPKTEQENNLTDKIKENDGSTASGYKIPDLPELPSKGKLIFVFDDAGHNLEQLQHFLNLPFPCTIAVLPKLPNSKEAARRIRAAGKELILHQPMQALNPNIDPGPGAVKPGMSREEIKTIVASNVEEIGPIAGMNNHEGSLITSDETAMEAVLELCREKNIYFLDSRTSSKSVVPRTAKKLNMNIWERAVFLDNKRDKAYMKKRIIDGLEIASQKGEAIMIGHVVTVDLAALLKEMYVDLSREGYTFSTISKSKN